MVAHYPIIQAGGDAGGRSGETEVATAKATGSELVGGLVSERMLDAEPELRRRRRVDGAGEVETQRRPLQEAEPGNIQPQSAADRVSDRPHRMPAQVGVPRIVERRQRHP